MRHWRSLAAAVAVASCAACGGYTVPPQHVTGAQTAIAAARARLDTVAVALKQAPDRKIVVEGYTDSTGTDAVNMPLSQARASEVRAYLISRGVPEQNIIAKGFGPDRPIASNKTAEGRASNRRVEIVVPTGAAEPMPEEKSPSPKH